MDYTKLDNPVWFSLNETHYDRSISFDGVMFYKPDYCPFGGFINIDNTALSLDQYANSISNFYVVGEQPKFHKSLLLYRELICDQMILDTRTSILCEFDEEIIELNDEHTDDLLRLINIVQPGYFMKRTAQLGNYYGIYQDNQLVAVTGERMKMNGFTEVSAVVTHPQYTGRGLAKKLVSKTCNRILLENKIPFLHVAETNVGAIKLYQKLGFVTRRKISFWNFIK